MTGIIYIFAVKSPVLILKPFAFDSGRASKLLSALLNQIFLIRSLNSLKFVLHLSETDRLLKLRSKAFQAFLLRICKAFVKIQNPDIPVFQRFAEIILLKSDSDSVKKFDSPL